MNCSLCAIGGLGQVRIPKEVPAVEGDLCAHCARLVREDNERAEATKDSAIRFAGLGKKLCAKHGETWHSIGEKISFCLACQNPAFM